MQGNGSGHQMVLYRTVVIGTVDLVSISHICALRSHWSTLQRFRWFPDSFTKPALSVLK